jgi:AcrR family transcriptional regulator
MACPSDWSSTVVPTSKIKRWPPVPHAENVPLPPEDPVLARVAWIKLHATLMVMSSHVELSVPASLVRIAIQVAEQRREDVADVPLTALAQAAGLSRSTLLRRIGGSRRALDEAVRAAGVDPGGRQPVRERAVAAAAQVIGERGLAAATLEAIAEAAGCSVHSLYAVFGGRDELLTAIYERYSPLREIERLAAEPGASLEETVHAVYRALVANLGREPRVAPAMLAELFSRPDGPVGRIFREYFPRALSGIGRWLATEADQGRIRPLPVPLLIQQLLGPLVMHLLLRPAMTPELGASLPTEQDTCAVFADNFLRAVAVPGAWAAASTATHPPTGTESEA